VVEVLIEFSVANYLSFKDLATFSMVPTSIRELKDSNVFTAVPKLNLLKSSAIYGANASGKSNLCKAMQFMTKFVQISSKDTQVGEDIDTVFFKLSSETDQQPSFFEMVFLKEGVIYRYGFQVDKTRVINEWLYHTSKSQESLLFERTLDGFELTDEFSEGHEWTERTRDNALFLSVNAQFKGRISTKLVEWFSTQFRVISGLTEYTKDSISELSNEEMKDWFLSFLQIADIGIDDINIEKKEIDLSKFPEGLRKMLVEGKMFWKDSIEVKMLHKKFDNMNDFIGHVKFDLETEESQGTKKLFSLLGPILESLSKGKTLVVDEIDTNLHPLLTKKIVELYHSLETNPLNAQIIITTHDTNLLNNKIYRRDQVWFAEKSKYGATILYSLVEYIKNNARIRKDEAYERNYLMGKYGAIPYIGQFRFRTR
jgi:hypothetical protein